MVVKQKKKDSKNLAQNKHVQLSKLKKVQFGQALQYKDIFSKSKPNLYGSSSFQQAHQDCLLEWIDEDIFKPVAPLLKVQLELTTTKPTKPELKLMTDAIDLFMPLLEKFLEENTFLCGNFITLSDINAALTLKPLFEVHFEDTDRKKFRNVTRWFNTMVNQKELKSVVGATKLKEAKKEIVSSLDMETWKRFYMNNSHDDSIAYLWKNIDIKVNGFFVCDYKDFADIKGQKLFLTRNLTSGIAQRAQDLCSKTSFGIILICGVEEGEHTIKILWLMESKTVPKLVIDELSDYDSFNWRAANWKKDSDKKEIESFLRQQDPTGLPVLDVKVFR